MEKKLSDLIERLKAAFGDGLISAILYGSAAMGDWHEPSSDLNVLCVLSRLSPQELAQSEPIFRWWREQGNPPPLLLTPEEVRSSTDCFPMEFHDMQEHRRVLYGTDVIQGLDIDRSFYRAQVEHELRAKQIRLRQKAAELLSNRGRLVKLLTESISTFCVLGRHALILSGKEPRWKKREIVAALEGVMGMPLSGANEILAIRAAGKRPRDVDAVALLGRYLAKPTRWWFCRWLGQMSGCVANREREQESHEGRNNRAGDCGFGRCWIFGGQLMGERNQFVTEKNDIDARWAQVDNDMKRRADLIPNLVETVKGYAKQEQTVIGEVANARAALLGAHSKQDEITREQSAERRHWPAAGAAGELSSAQIERKLPAVAG